MTKTFHSRVLRHGVGDGWTYRFIRQMCQGCPLLVECRGDKRNKVAQDKVDSASEAPEAPEGPPIVLTPRNVYYSDYRVPYLRAVNYSIGLWTNGFLALTSQSRYLAYQS